MEHDAASKTSSRVEVVRLHLLQAIFSGKYPPGSPLRETGLARELGVSHWKCSGNQTLYRLLDQLTMPLVAFASIVLSYCHEHLADVVHAHQPRLDALRAKTPALIEDAFRTGAESFYREYLGNGLRARNAMAFGLLSTGATNSAGNG